MWKTRIRRLFSWSSIPGWLAAFGQRVYQLINGASNADWVRQHIGLSTMWQLLSAHIETVLWVSGLAWLTFLVVRPDSAKESVADDRAPESSRASAVQPPATITIHRAVYGTDPTNDTDVTDVLRRAARDSLIIPIENDVMGRDPIFGVVKRLEVEYSHGNRPVRKVSRPEHACLILPVELEAAILGGHPKPAINRHLKTGN